MNYPIVAAGLVFGHPGLSVTGAMALVGTTAAGRAAVDAMTRQGRIINDMDDCNRGPVRCASVAGAERRRRSRQLQTRLRAIPPRPLIHLRDQIRTHSRQSEVRDCPDWRGCKRRDQDGNSPLSGVPR
jgi:hypothetical protein